MPTLQTSRPLQIIVTGVDSHVDALDHPDVPKMGEARMNADGNPITVIGRTVMPTVEQAAHDFPTEFVVSIAWGEPDPLATIGTRRVEIVPVKVPAIHDVHALRGVPVDKVFESMNRP